MKLAGLASLSLLAGIALAAPSVSTTDSPSSILSAPGYVAPADPIAEAVLAPWHLNHGISNIDPSGRISVISESEGLPPIEKFARPHAILAGVQIDLNAYRSRGMTTTSTVGFTFYHFFEGRKVEAQVPEGMDVSGITWSPNGEYVAFVGSDPNGSYAHVANANTGAVRRVGNLPMLATQVTGLQWTDEGRSLAFVTKPGGHGNRNPSSGGINPLVRVSGEFQNRIRTYSGLLQTDDDVDLLEYYLTGIVTVVDVQSGRTRTIGEEGMITSLSAAPTGDGFIVEYAERPFSFLVPFGNFGRKQVLLDAEGEQKHQISSRNLSENEVGRPAQAQQRGAQVPFRNLRWHPDGSGLLYMQRAPGNADDRADTLYLWKAPFTSETRVKLFEKSGAIEGLILSPDSDYIYHSENDGNETVWFKVKVSSEDEQQEIFRFRRGDFFNNPGSFETQRGRWAGQVMMEDGHYLYLSGTRFFRNPDVHAPRPFIYRLDTRTGEIVESIFESSASMFETANMLDAQARHLVVTREDRRTVPNSFLIDREANSEVQLTENVDFLPDITNAEERHVEIVRNDGFRFFARVLLPDEGEGSWNRPAMFWFYPSEVTNQNAYDNGRRTRNINRFPNVRSSSLEIFLRAGYVVVFPDCPIVGPSENVNNTFVPQLRANLYATIDALSKRGLIDRERLALGGHSYGGFGTANALVHTPFFKAGIAGAGNYNRSLTPFGFQREGRQLWEMREVYFTMSPLMHVENMSGALLLYHGMQDQNMGTAPINSERMYQALEALGKTSALYMYPYEDHGQRARETRLDMWARWVAWLDEHVKGD